MNIYLKNDWADSIIHTKSHLLNADKTTNFIYKINNLKLSGNEITKINSIKSRSEISDRIKIIIDKGGKFDFLKAEKRIFHNNLILIESLLPQIISIILFKFYSTSSSKLLDLLSSIEKKNPLKYYNSSNYAFYSNKIKHLLTDIALGMIPSKVWNGRYDATGGCLTVKDNGDIVCNYHYNKNEFEDYLLNNTKLETASSSRHDFGQLYKENGELFFKLNLHIRFVK